MCVCLYVHIRYNIIHVYIRTCIHMLSYMIHPSMHALMHDTCMHACMQCMHACMLAMIEPLYIRSRTARRRRLGSTQTDRTGRRHLPPSSLWQRATPAVVVVGFVFVTYFCWSGPCAHLPQWSHHRNAHTHHSGTAPTLPAASTSEGGGQNRSG